MTVRLNGITLRSPLHLQDSLTPPIAGLAWRLHSSRLTDKQTSNCYALRTAWWSRTALRKIVFTVRWVTIPSLRIHHHGT